MPPPWTCAACESEVDDSLNVCDGCDEPRPPPPASAEKSLIVVARILSVDAIASKDKLRAIRLDVGESEPITVVTNAPNVAVGLRCVVALPGAKLEVEGEEVVIKAQAVGGVKSHGMLCDGPMLKWVGGGAGMAALVPETHPLGMAPPATRPRLKSSP